MFDEMNDYAERNWGFGLGIEEDFEDPQDALKKIQPDEKSSKVMTHSAKRKKKKKEEDTK